MKNKKELIILCLILILTTAVFAGCSDSKNEKTTAVGTSTEANSDASVIGEGEKQFVFKAVDKDGNETCFEVHTDKNKVGEALLELGLIEGEDGDYGLYVKSVNGITADYDKDGVYWAFYVDGEYATTGVDKTDITEGAEYSFRIEK